MTLIADLLLAAGAMGAGIYCFILSRRLRRFTDLENGVGGAVTTLAKQVDDLTRALKLAQGTSSASATILSGASDRAEAAAGRIELLLASLHDLPEIPAKEPMSPFYRRNEHRPESQKSRTAS